MRALPVVFAGGSIIAAAACFLLSETEYARYTDPSDRFEVVVSVRRVWGCLPSMPGQAGDRPARVTICERAGHRCGTVPVAMAQQARDLVWTGTGAEIVALGSWDFARGEVRYWDVSQESETVRPLR